MSGSAHMRISLLFLVYRCTRFRQSHVVIAIERDRSRTGAGTDGTDEHPGSTVTPEAPSMTATVEAAVPIDE